MQEVSAANTPPFVSFTQPQHAATAGLRSFDEPLEAVALQLVEERSILRKFVCTARHVAQHVGMEEEWTVQQIAELAHIELENIHRESALGLTLWISWLQTTAQFTPCTQLKYQCVTDFLVVYVCFVGYQPKQQEQLMHVANWMAYLLSKIPARKNKGFVLQVIPKLVEGWNAKYITGSGQSRATEDRVKIYEVEGDIQPTQRTKPPKQKRGKLVAKKRKYGWCSYWRWRAAIVARQHQHVCSELKCVGCDVAGCWTYDDRRCSWENSRSRNNREATQRSRHQHTHHSG